MSMQTADKRAAAPPLPHLEEKFEDSALALSSLLSTVQPERIGTTKELLTAKEALATQYRKLMEASAAYIAASEKAGSKAAASVCRTRVDDLSTAKSSLEVALDQKSRDLEDQSSCAGTVLTRASLRSLRLRTPPRSAVESTSDEDEDDPEAALAQVELELRCSQLELRRNKLIAKVRSVKSHSESGRSNGTSISSRPPHSRVDEWVSSQRGARSDRASQVGGRAVSLAPSIAIGDAPVEEPVYAPVVNVESKFGASNATQAPVLDVSSRFMLIAELKRAPKKLYTGEPQHFDNWLHNLQRRIGELQLGPREAMEVLANHSTGEPHELIMKYSSAVHIDQQQQLRSILTELRRRFGSSERIALHMYDRLLRSPEIHGKETEPGVALKLRQFGDLCQTVHFAMGSAPALRLLDDFLGMEPIKKKLPSFAYTSWRRECSRYREKNQRHPDFGVFTNFVLETANNLCDDPRIDSIPTPTPPSRPNTKNARVLLGNSQIHPTCAFHPTSAHQTTDCANVKKMDSASRRRFLQEKRLCFRCLGPHRAAACKATVKCETCGGTSHHTLAHSRRDESTEASGSKTALASRSTSATEPKDGEPAMPRASVLCTSSCDEVTGRSCSKVLLADVYDPYTEHSRRVYVILDDHSNFSFCLPWILDDFGITGPRHTYSVTTLGGHRKTMLGRSAENLMIRGVSEEKSFELPRLFENDYIPDLRNEVATREIVAKHPKISRYAERFLPLDPTAEVAILLGRDSNRLMPSSTDQTAEPMVYRTVLGWAVVGSTCPMNAVTSRKRATTLKTAAKIDHDHFSLEKTLDPELKTNVFAQFRDDEELGLSPEDLRFLNHMKKIRVNQEGHLEAPLPLKDDEQRLPDNAAAVRRRQVSTLARLQKDPEKLNACIVAMGKNIAERHVEPVPNCEAQRKPAWYIPVFPVTHKRKGKTRLVFDSAAVYYGTSLNSILLSGPDQNNRLRSVMTRFREQVIGFVADVESMFHAFQVSEDHRQFLMFFWWKDNDPKQQVISYRARVHVFGNTSSPAVATMCLRKAADGIEGKTEDLKDRPHFRDAQSYIISNFYCDDGLGTAASPSDAIGVLSMAKSILARYQIRLHKIVSNSPEVLAAFPPSERAAGSEVEFFNAPIHSTLGVIWNVRDDCFTLKVSLPERPFTRRGMLSVTNSVYDPIGFVCPVILGGRLIMRKVLTGVAQDSDKRPDWDEPLENHQLEEWTAWLSSLQALDQLAIPRCFLPPGFGEVMTQTLHVFADASLEAIGNVSYLRSVNSKGEVHVVFVHGESRVAPRAATSVPRLELCAAVEAVSSCQQIVSDLKRPVDRVHYYSDSKVVLAYIKNESKRFSRYVQRRVDLVRHGSQPSDWIYVDTASNPADFASRPTEPGSLRHSTWLTGPPFLMTSVNPRPDLEANPDLYTEELPELESAAASTLQTRKSEDEQVFRQLSGKLSSWTAMLRVATRVVIVSRLWMRRLKRGPGKSDVQAPSPDPGRLAHNLLVSEAQRQSFSDLIALLSSGKQVRPHHRLVKLSPFLDKDGILRVGGRLKLTDLAYEIKHPILLPDSHPVSAVIFRHYHQKTKHQGRLVSHAAIREGGYHLEHGRRAVKRLLESCVTCRRLRALPHNPRMADLPVERTSPAPPFTAIGMDVFGHWWISNGPSTRKNSSQRKCWALLLTCLASRAVHVECLPALDTTTFINAFKRFLALRGPCNSVRSDRGSNFIGAKNQASEVNLEQVTRTLTDLGVTWTMNPPHASHFGGVWERKIGQVRRALDAAILATGNRTLSYDELNTFLQEAAAIVNATPLWDAPYDPTEIVPITPNMLLTQKYGNVEPHPELTEKDALAYGPRRWRRVQVMANNFWMLWRKTHLLHLQTRNKWTQIAKELAVGDLVLVKEKNASRSSWPVGVVETTHKSHDGVVRSATVRLSQREPSERLRRWVRPCADLVLLQRVAEKGNSPNSSD